MHTNSIKDVVTSEDIFKLTNAAGNFHDAIVERWDLHEGAVHVLIDTTWDCKIELWFSGDVSCSVCALTPDSVAYTWFASTLLYENGYFYFNSEMQATAESIENACCWFKSHHLQYRVIPYHG